MRPSPGFRHDMHSAAGASHDAHVGRTDAAAEREAGHATAVREEVFIGGMGQSGTSMLNWFLGAHADILVCPFETSFIITTNGLMDITRAISDEYSPFRLDVMLHEFDRLMHHHLCSPRSYPYNRFDLAGFFGERRYHAAVDRFFARLGITRYEGDGLTIGPFARLGPIHSPSKLKRFPLPARLTRERTYLYYSERQTREAALAAARDLLADLFGAKARSEGKRVWCEQTTTNQQFAGFLLTLCPAGLYIDMMRDPLDVALAHLAQDWAPDDFGMICRSLRAQYERWFDVRGRLPSGSFLEVRFEDLTARPEQELARVCEAIGLPYDPAMIERRPDERRLRQERDRRKGADLATYRRLLGPIAEQLGYGVP